MLQLRDVEEIESKEKVEKEVEEEEDDDSETVSRKAQVDEKVPTARVVGIVKRNWRQYCGTILQPAVKGLLWNLRFFRSWRNHKKSLVRYMTDISIFISQHYLFEPFFQTL